MSREFLINKEIQLQTRRNNLILISKYLSTCNHCFGLKKVSPKPGEPLHHSSSVSENSELIEEPGQMYFANSRPSILMRDTGDSKKKFNLNAGKTSIQTTPTPAPVTPKKHSSVPQNHHIRMSRNSNRSCSQDSVKFGKLKKTDILKSSDYNTIQISNNAPISKVSSTITNPIVVKFRWSLGNLNHSKTEDSTRKTRHSFSVKQKRTYISSVLQQEMMPFDINTKPKENTELLENEKFGKLNLFQRESSVKASHEATNQIAPIEPNLNDGKVVNISATEQFSSFIQDFKDMKNQSQFLFKGSLGEGAYGEVIECLDLRRKRLPVAIKVLKKLLNNNGDRTHELNILQSIEQKDSSQFNPCVTLLQYFSIGKRLCLVFRRYGDNLYNFMKKRKFEPLQYNLISQIAYQIFYACTFLHDKCKIIHTDLKPENIVFTSSIYISKEERGIKTNLLPTKFDIKIIDFGNAVPITREKYRKLIGTRHYRALEVILDEVWDEKVDCWSVGCILYELYTGGVLFGATNDTIHLAMIDRIIGPIESKLTKHTKKAHLFLKNGRFNKAILQYYELIECKPSIQFHFKQFCHQSRLLTNIIIRCLKNDPKERPNFRDLLKCQIFNYLPDTLKRKYKKSNVLK